MKWKASLICFLGLVMGIASLDTVPDPPAVNPHRPSICSRVREAHGGARQPPLSFSAFRTSHLQVRRIALASSKSNITIYCVAIMRFAADPSPPSLEA
ncbi:MAG TPA: hypothetical protein VH596_11415 [Terriglobales bacterium]|jgi:hypothetical protein